MFVGQDHVKIVVDHDDVSIVVTERRWVAFCKAHPRSVYVGTTITDSGVFPTNAYGELSRLVATEELKRITTLTSRIVARYQDVVVIAREVERLDVDSSLYLNSSSMRHVRPTLQGIQGVRAVGLRHPVIELMKSRRETYVENSLELSYEKGHGGMLLYGVNAVGKSSIMKSLGIAVVMAQAGMFVAAESFDLKPFKSLFTRIGLRDDIKRGRSTFVVEMMELRDILKRASSSSLVIGDELCAGTETPSALAIVGAGVATLSHRGVPFVLATHLHELVDLDVVRESPGVVAMHLSVSRDPQSLGIVFERKLRPGPGEKTYGVEIARSLDMGHDFIKLAERIRRTIMDGHDELVKKRLSRYNTRLVLNACGVCGLSADETHHIVPQKYFQRAESRVKNALSNLLPLCGNCHKAAHDKKLHIRGFKLTDKGICLDWSTTNSSS